jgi:putative heme iron utilization protein
MRTGTLCTVALDPPGYPYGSFVTFGLDGGEPLFLVSELAEHTRNLRADERASLLVSEQAGDDPLACGRVTLLGRCRPVGDDDVLRDRTRTAYLAAQPSAAYYVDFADFHFWRLEVESVRYIGGYGRMSWVGREEWAGAEPDPLAPHSAGILAHMNQDHPATMVEFCRKLSRATDTTAASMTSVDRYGFEMSAVTAVGPRPVRIGFSRLLATPDEVRHELVALARRVRGG